LSNGVVCILITAMFLVPVNMASVNETKPISETPSMLLGENLAPNPSFEEGTGDMPDGWECFDWKDGSVIDWCSNDSHSGEKSVSVTNIQQPRCLYSWGTTELIPVDFTKNVYDCAVWYKYRGQPTEEQEARFCLWLYDANREDTHRFWIGVNLPYSTEWRYESRNTDHFYNEEYKEKTKYVKLYLFQSSNGDINPEVKIWFDDVFFGIRTTQLQIKDISGGFGISATVENVGETDASNIEWSIDIAGNVMIGSHFDGVISSLQSGGSVKIRSGFVLGFGPARITIVAAGEAQTVNCFVIGPFLLGMT
ncbi:hypothetical protein, partial [Vibrio sp.]|uniref:hypothetical protein n=1 Tax=Vibrio sp. TaxID=678 RepID=UPI003D0BF202